MADPVRVGTVSAIWRYPVRSLRGEALAETAVSELGLPGDRAHAVIAAEDGHVAAAAKEPRTWAGLLGFEARLAGDASAHGAAPPVELRHESGEVLRSDAADFDARFSTLLGREAHLWAGDCRGALSHAARHGQGEQGVPEPPYPSAPLHLLTTSSLAAAKAHHPDGCFEPVRFRPNLVVDTGEAPVFAEAGWVGGRLHVGDAVTLHVFKECERCVLTTLAQDGLPKDTQVLKTVTTHNGTNMGIYCAVPRPGTIRVGDAVSFEPAEASG